MKNGEPYVVLSWCGACDRHWTEEHIWGETWVPDNCGACGYDDVKTVGDDWHTRGERNIIYARVGQALIWDEDS